VESPTSGASLRVFAIYVVLNDAPFIEASLESVYPFAERIHVLTAHDKTWDGTVVEPDGTLDKVLAFPDPEGKIAVTRMWCPEDSLARNWLMASYVQTGRRAGRVKPHAVAKETIEDWRRVPDFFWIVDGDEIYDPETVPRIFDYIARSRASWINVWAHVYFKTWNYRVSKLEAFTAFLRPGRYLESVRNPRVRKPIGYVGRIPLVGRTLMTKMLRMEVVPPQVGVFHHPAYVGPTERIAAKIAHTPHRDFLVSDWLERVWEPWTPESKNFHPTHPEAFPSAEYVPEEELPEIVRKRRWPEGYMGKVG
jgi:hypothetical protein